MPLMASGANCSGGVSALATTTFGAGSGLSPPLLSGQIGLTTFLPSCSPERLLQTSSLVARKRRCSRHCSSLLLDESDVVWDVRRYPLQQGFQSQRPVTRMTALPLEILRFQRP